MRAKKPDPATDPQAFLERLFSLADSTVSDAELHASAMDGKFHELLGVPKSLFEFNGQGPEYIAFDAYEPLTAGAVPGILGLQPTRASRAWTNRASVGRPVGSIPAMASRQGTNLESHASARSGKQKLDVIRRFGIELPSKYFSRAAKSVAEEAHA